jgi:hypothetical protein
MKTNVNKNKTTTEWKHTSFISTPPLVDQSTYKNTGKNTPGINYANVQLPIMDEFVKSLSEIANSSANVFAEPFETADETYDETDELIDMVDPLDGKHHSENENDALIGLNANETRLRDKRTTDNATPDNTDIGRIAAMSRTTTPGNTVQQTTDEIKRTELTQKWNAFTKLRTLKTAKELAVAILDNIPHLFYVPDMIAKQIVNHGTPSTQRNTIAYLNNRNIVKSHMKLLLTLLIVLYITFNWWNLLFYTNHYIDFYAILNSPVFTPIAWIIKSVLSPLTTLNYFLLGKRLEPDIIQSYINPILKNKALFLSALFIILLACYDPFIRMYSTQTKQIIEGKDTLGSSALLLFIIAFCVINFLSTVVFNNQNIEVLVLMATNFLITIFIYIIVFILIVVFCKFTVVILAAYIAFYSLLHFFVDKTVFVPWHIVKMVNDTTDGWVENDGPADEKEGPGIIAVIKKIFVKYSFIILLFAVVITRVVQALVETRKITVTDVRVMCYAIYAALLLAIVFAGYYAYITIKNRMAGLQMSKDLFQPASSDTSGESEDITNTNYNRNKRYVTVVEDYGLPFLELIKIIIEYIVLSPFLLLSFITKPFMGESSATVSFFRRIIESIHGVFNVNLSVSR